MQGVVSVILMSCSLLASTVTIVLTTVSIVKDADRLHVTVDDARTSVSCRYHALQQRNHYKLIH